MKMVTDQTLYATTDSIPRDNTVPESTEGLELFSTSYTPAASDSKLTITTGILAHVTGGYYAQVAIFDNGTCVAAGELVNSGNNGSLGASGVVTVSDTSARTISVRVGVISPATLSINKITTNGINGTGGLSGSFLIIEDDKATAPIIETHFNKTEYSTTAVIPLDDTTPLVSEGTEVLAINSYTPTSASNDIWLIGYVQVTHDTAGQYAVVALFEDSTCLAAVYNLWGAGNPDTLPIAFKVSAATTSARSYTVRVGTGASGTVYVNQDDSAGVGYNDTEGSLLRLYEVAT